jgi:hypothetical protein
VVTMVQELLLPVGRSQAPCRVMVGTARVEVTWVAEGLWQISEQLGATSVQHGHLRQRPTHFEVSTAHGVQARAVGWERAVRLHLAGRRT